MNINELFIEDDEENEIKGEDKNSYKKTIKLSDLVPFKNHIFKLYKGKRLEDMVSSIKEYGILTPLIIRPLDNGKYEILSGHNRVNAAKIAGIEAISEDSFVIKEGLTDTDARTIVNETNVIQRGFSELSYSEKASVLAERHSTIKDQGKRKELIEEIEKLYKADGLEENSDLGKVCPNENTREVVADKYDLSPRMVSYYLRIDTLIDELKERLDDEEIPFMAAVDLSFLKKEEQGIVENILETHGFKINLKKSDVLKLYSQGRNFNYDKAYEVLSGKFFDKPKKAKNFRFTNKFKKSINKYFKENQSQSDIEKIIEEALEMYFSQGKEVDDELNQGEIEI